jgi:hypothetical protein
MKGRAPAKRRSSIDVAVPSEAPGVACFASGQPNEDLGIETLNLKGDPERLMLLKGRPGAGHGSSGILLQMNHAAGLGARSGHLAECTQISFERRAGSTTSGEPKKSYGEPFSPFRHSTLACA